MAEVSVVVSERPAEAACEWVVHALERITRENGFARLAIAGGSVVGVVGMIRRALDVRTWRALHLTWVDERMVPFDHLASNRGDAYRLGALTPAQPVERELPLFLDGEDAASAVERASAAFKRHFDGGLDVALLGMGEDGHVASLFPNHALLDATAPIAALHDAPKPPPERVTLTLPVLSKPNVLRVVVASGAAKQAALARLVSRDASVPAARLGALTLVTDTKPTPLHRGDA